jgi:hypothetical protein
MLFVICVSLTAPIAPILIPTVQNSANQNQESVTYIQTQVQCTTSTTTVNGYAVPTTSCNPQVTSGGSGILSNLYIFGDYIWGIARGIALYITEFTVVGSLLASFGIPSIIIIPFQVLVWFGMARWLIAFFSGRAFVVE